MKTLFLFSLCLALAAADESLKVIPPLLRHAAQVWPCEAPQGCPLSGLFAKNDPQGDAFVADHVVWISVRNESDTKAKGQQLRIAHTYDPWLRNLQKRSVFFATATCPTGDVNCKSFDPNIIYVFPKNRGIVSYHFEELFEFPSDLIFESLRVAYNLPADAEKLEKLVSMTGLPWEQIKLFVLVRRENGQIRFIATEVGGFLQHFRVPVFQLQDSDPKSPQSGEFAVYDTSDCNLQTVDKCKFLRTIPAQDGKWLSTAEELACDIFLSKHPSRKIHAKEVDAAYIERLTEVCPVVVLMHLEDKLPTGAVDAALNKFKHWKLVTVLFDGKAPVEGRSKAEESLMRSGSAAQIIIRKDRWSEAQSLALDVSSEEAFRSDLENKVAIYEFLRSTRPEVTYLRVGASDDGFFTLNHDLQDQLDIDQLGLLSKAKHISGGQFQIAKKLPYVMIHFYQTWNPVCRAVHETINRMKKILQDMYQIKRFVITSINCFKDDKICLEQGVYVYPTLKIYSRGVAEDFNEMVTLRNLLKPALLSFKELKAKIVDEKRWEKVMKDFTPVMDLIFVGVDLSESTKKSFAAAEEALKRTDLLIEADRSALPSEVQKALPDKTGCIFALNPKLRSVEAVLSKEAGNEDILDFVKNSKLFILTELTIGGLFEIEQQSKPLLIAFVRDLDADLMATLLGITRAYKGQAFVRWMNASALETVGVMQAYNIAHTPSLLLKINDKIFPFTGPRIDAKVVGEWIGEVTGNKIPSLFTLKETEHRSLAQYLDHVGSIYDNENMAQDDKEPEQTPQPPVTPVKEEL